MVIYLWSYKDTIWQGNTCAKDYRVTYVFVSQKIYFLSKFFWKIEFIGI